VIANIHNSLSGTPPVHISQLTEIRGAKLRVLSDNQKEIQWFYSVSQGFMIISRERLPIGLLIRVFRNKNY
jgi:hypothetical protein